MATLNTLDDYEAEMIRLAELALPDPNKAQIPAPYADIDPKTGDWDWYMSHPEYARVQLLHLASGMRKILWQDRRRAGELLNRIASEVARIERV